MRSILLLLLVLPVVSASSAPRELTEEQKATHALNRLGYGPRPGDVARVESMGIREYIEQQLHPEQIGDNATDSRLAMFPSIHMNADELLERYPQPQQAARQAGLQKAKAGDNLKADRAQLQNAMQQNGQQRPQLLLQELESQRIIRAVYSERQLQEVMTGFWFNHFNVDWKKGQDKWFTTEYEMNAIRPHVMGKFKDLLMATAKSPAMLFYLDNHLSSAPNTNTSLNAAAAARRVNPKNPLAPLIQARTAAAANVNKGKARNPGINENYGRELMELHTMGVDGGYTQKDVQEVARSFTGWTIDQPRQSAEFIFRPAMHDRGEKVVLGHTIRAGGGIEDGEQVIDILAHHPSTARFISTKLVRYFVSDNPPQSLIDKVAATYMKTDGDIREMLRTIFYSEEFMSPDAYQEKSKSALEYVASAIRAVNGETNGGPRLAQLLGKMGQPLYQYVAPTGFPDRADYWISDGSLVERINFAVNLTLNKIPDTRVQLTTFRDPNSAALYLGSPEFQKR